MYSYLDYLSSNKLIKYPFKESSSLPEPLSKDFITDFVIITDDFNSHYYINKILNTSESLQIFINDLIVFTIDVSLTNKIYTFESSEYISRILINDASNIPYGIFTFSQEETSFEECCVIPKSKNVRKIILEDDKELIGDITILEGYNTKISEANNSIAISAIVGEGLGNTPCDEEKQVIYSINNQGTDKNYVIQGSDCIEVLNYSNNNMIVVYDRCKPCCEDCENDLQNMNNDVETMQTDIDDLDVRLTALGG